MSRRYFILPGNPNPVGVVPRMPRHRVGHHIPPGGSAQADLHLARVARHPAQNADLLVPDDRCRIECAQRLPMHDSPGDWIRNSDSGFGSITGAVKGHENGPSCQGRPW